MHDFMPLGDLDLGHRSLLPRGSSFRRCLIVGKAETKPNVYRWYTQRARHGGETEKAEEIDKIAARQGTYPRSCPSRFCLRTDVGCGPLGLSQGYCGLWIHSWYYSYNAVVWRITFTPCRLLQIRTFRRIVFVEFFETLCSARASRRYTHIMTRQVWTSLDSANATAHSVMTPWSQLNPRRTLRSLTVHLPQRL
jgi:hypothetical protein